MSRRSLRRESLRSAFWLVPGLALATGIAAGLLLPELDEGVDMRFGVLAFGGEPPAARDLLAAIAGLTISVVGLAFSVTLVALQLASQQLSPRVLRTFRRDPLNQATLGAFLGTAVYALLVLRTVREGADAFVPGLSVGLALGATVACLALFVAFVANIVVSLQPSTVIERVGEDGRAAIEAARPGDEAGVGRRPTGGRIVSAPSAGFVLAVDLDDLVPALARAGAVAHQLVPAGEFVLTGQPLAEVRVDDAHAEAVCDRVRDAFPLGRERTPAGDVAFPVRQLADIALKGLSPSLNDPTTAENAMGRLGDPLVRAAALGPGPRAVRDHAGEVRFVTAEPDLADLIRLGFEQVRGSIGGDAVFAARLLEILRRVDERAGGRDHGEARRQAEEIRRAFDDAPLAADRERVDGAWRALVQPG